VRRAREGYRYPDVVKTVLAGKSSLVTGASRGIGAATAVKLAEAGSDIVLNYRSKTARAEEVAAHIQALGRRALAVQADLTNNSELQAMMGAVKESFGSLDLLILNASGGLEKGKPEGYPMLLNQSAQLATAKLAAELMPRGARIVFVTSHWAHFYGTKPVLPAYEVVAKSKRAGEDALREYAGQLATRGISLVVVSGDAIEGTITLRLLERKSPGSLADRLEANRLPTVDEFADAIVAAAIDPALPNGHTVFVGSTDW
jgi:NAD(P)-dependent dehydrogenase (short-subunit alcohol dehydrogenase family)